MNTNKAKNSEPKAATAFRGHNERTYRSPLIIPRAIAHGSSSSRQSPQPIPQDKVLQIVKNQLHPDCYLRVVTSLKQRLDIYARLTLDLSSCNSISRSHQILCELIEARDYCNAAYSLLIDAPIIQQLSYLEGCTDFRSDHPKYDACRTLLFQLNKVKDEHVLAFHGPKAQSWFPGLDLNFVMQDEVKDFFKEVGETAHAVRDATKEIKSKLDTVEESIEFFKKSILLSTFATSLFEVGYRGNRSSLWLGLLATSVALICWSSRSDLAEMLSPLITRFTSEEPQAQSINFDQDAFSSYLTRSIAMFLIGNAMKSFSFENHSFMNLVDNLSWNFRSMSSVAEILRGVMDSIFSVLNFMSVSIFGCDIVNPLSGTCNDLQKWVDDVNNFQRDMDRGKYDFGIDAFDYLNLLEERITFLLIDSKKTAYSDVVFKVINVHRNKLASMRNIFIQMNLRAVTTRPSPLCVAAFGPPGIGKTYLTEKLASDIYHICFNEHQKKHYGSDMARITWLKPKASKFSDAYKAHPIGVIDDAFNQKDSTANPDTDAIDIIKWVNTSAALMNSAEMALKAINQCKMRLLIVNTNLKTLTGLTSITDIGAVARRLHIPVLVSVCPAFRVNPDEKNLWAVKTDFSKFPKDAHGVPVPMTEHYEFHLLDLNKTDAHHNYVVTKTMDYTEFLAMCCKKFQTFAKEHESKVEFMESSKPKFEDVYVRKGCDYDTFTLEMDRRFAMGITPGKEPVPSRQDFDLRWHRHWLDLLQSCKKEFVTNGKTKKIVTPKYFRFEFDNHEVALPIGMAIGFLEHRMTPLYGDYSNVDRSTSVMDYHSLEDESKVQIALPLAALRLAGTTGSTFYGMCVLSGQHFLYKFDLQKIREEVDLTPKAQALADWIPVVNRSPRPVRDSHIEPLNSFQLWNYFHAFQSIRPHVLTDRSRRMIDEITDLFDTKGIESTSSYFSFLHYVSCGVYSSNEPGIRFFLAADKYSTLDANYMGHDGVELQFFYEAYQTLHNDKVDTDAVGVKSRLEACPLICRAIYNVRFGLFSGCLPNWDDMWNQVVHKPDFSYRALVKSLAVGFGVFALTRLVVNILGFLFTKLSGPVAQAAPVDYPRSSVAKSTYFDQTGEAIANILLKSNTYELLNDADVRINYLLFYCGTKYVTNAHSLDNLALKYEANPNAVLKLRNLHSKQVQMDVPISEFIKNHKISSRDLGFGEISVNYMAPKRDIRKFFITRSTTMPEKFLARWAVPSNDRMNDYEREVKKLSYSRLEKSVPEAFIKDDSFRYLNSVNDKYVTSSEGYFYKNSHNAGDCGAPLYTMDTSQRQQRIFAIHASGMTKSVDSYATALFYEDLIEADNIINNNFIMDIMEEPKSQSRYEEDFEVLSKYPNKSSQMTETMLTKSQFHNILGPVDLAPSDLTMPLVKCMKKYSKPKPVIDPQTLRIAVRHTYATILSENQDRGPVSYTKRSFGEAVWGIEGNKFFKGLAMSTSSGAPHIWQVKGVNGKKSFLGHPESIGPEMRHYVVEMFNYIYENECYDRKVLKEKFDIEESDVTHPMYIDLRFLSNIHYVIDPIKDFIAKAQKKELTEVLFVDYLKDELLKAGKDPRIFSCSPCWFTIVTRMYLGHFIEVCMANNTRNGISVGINPFSEEWDHMAKRLKQFPNLGDTDFKAYDTSHSAQINMENAYALNTYVYKYDYLESLVVTAIFLAVAHSLHVTDDFCIIRWLGSLPSGCPLTTILNCINQLILFRICWMIILGSVQAIFTFNTHVKLWAFGDDGNRTVSDYAKDIFTPEAIAKVMKQCGFDMTAGNKQGVGTYGDISTISYLKRTFVFSPVLNRYVGPLAKKSICKMLYWTKKKANKDEIVKNNLNKALLEASFHGEEYFDEVSNAIVKQCDLIGFPHPDVVDYRSAVYSNSQREPEFYDDDETGTDFYMPTM